VTSAFPKDPAPLLVVHQGALGDLILAHWAMRSVPGPLPAQSAAVVQASWIPLATDLLGFGQALAVESPWFASLFSRPSEQAGAFLSPFRTALVFSRNPLLAENLCRAGLAVIRVAPRPPLGESIHAAEYLARELAKGLGLEPPQFPPLYPEAPAPDPSRRRVVLHPGAGSRRKRWPLENFLALERLLSQKGLECTYLAGPAEPDLAAQLMDKGKGLHNLVSSSNLKPLIERLRGACGFVGNDSGVSHIAGLLGVCTVTVFGPSDPVRWRPLGPRCRVARGEVSCEPCFETRAQNCDHPACLLGVSPEEVAAALLEETGL